MAKFERIAVVGGGISGICSAAHLLQQGLSVVLYERSSISGGVWHFDPRQPLEASYPNEIPSRGDFEQISHFDDESYPTPPQTPGSSKASERPNPHLLATDDHASLLHAPPGPCYSGLKNNVSLPAMRTSLGSWPAGLDDFVSQKYLEEYIQTIAEVHGVNAIAQFNTRVEEIRKVDDQWQVLTTSLRTGSDGEGLSISRSEASFDAVVVASGHYHMPKIPSIPGLSAWKTRFPNRVAHSKGYRNAEVYRGRNVLIIGAGVSSFDIAKEIELVGGKVFQSSRNGLFDLPASSLPPSATRVAGVSRFVLNEGSRETNEILLDYEPIAGHIELADGSNLADIHHIIVATGYITSYPFLRDKHADGTKVEDADLRTLVTDGTMVHNLYKDIWYIEDPSLAFVGVPYHISTFSLFDFQAQIVARVFAGYCRLPDHSDMRSQYKSDVNRKGPGREYHSLRATGAEMEYVADLVSLANRRLPLGVLAMIGHTPEWLAAHDKQRRQLAARFGGRIEDWVPHSLLESD